MKYRTIVADPPWPQTGTGGKCAGWRNDWATESKPLDYPSMSIDEIRRLPLPDFAAKDCRIFLWTTNQFMPAAFGLLDSWGFRYRQTLTWGKPDANPLGGSVAPNSEFLLVAVTGHPARLGKLTNSVQWHPRGGLAHSEKPELFLDLVEQVSPGPRLEMFARRNRLGWDTWGNECLEHVRCG